MKLIKLGILFIAFVAAIAVAINWRSIFGSAESVDRQLAEIEQSMAPPPPTDNSVATGNIGSTPAAPPTAQPAKVADQTPETAPKPATPAKESTEPQPQQSKKTAVQQKQPEPRPEPQAAIVDTEKARSELLKLVNTENLKGCREHAGWSSCLTERERRAAVAVLDMSAYSKLKREKVRRLLDKKYDRGYFRTWNDVVKAYNDINHHDD